ncbi:MAG: CDP-2,3-bis-(O-geranylgeranyl)-sn-glycerol synthase [Candidatus Micrarchaeota archaeon]
MELYLFVFYSFIYILPAYICNSSAALFGGGLQLDGGRTWRGKPLLGAGKTWRGTLAGVFFGTVTAALIGIFFGQPFFYLMLGILLSAGAITGDLLKSVIKRQIGIAQGKPFIIVDQIDFLVFAMLFGLPLFVPSVETAVFLLLITPAIHLFVNAMGYLTKQKAVPY